MRVTFNTPLTKSLNLGHGKVKNNTVSQNSTQNSPIKNTLMDNPALRYGISFKAGYKDSDEEESLKKLEEYIEKNPEKKDMYETIINSAFYKNSQQFNNRANCLLLVLNSYDPEDTKTTEVIKKF